MTKVLLLNPPSKHGVAVVRDTFYGCWCKGRANYMWPPLALLCVGATLKKDGFDTSLLDATALRLTVDKTVTEVRRINPDYVIVNSATITFSNDVEVVKEIKSVLPDVKAIFVGTHVTVLPVESLKEPTIDYIILGEPDVVLSETIRAIEKSRPLGSTQGVGYRFNGKSVVNGVAPLIKDLDGLPFPARELLPKADIYFNPLAKRLPYTTMLSSRGCPFKCIYCTSGLLYGDYFRGRSAKNVVDEIEACLKLGYREVFFRDELFTFHRKRTENICQEIIGRGLDVTWMCNARVDTVNLETLELMKASGCHMIKFGVESGSQKVLDAINKGISLEQTRNAFSWSRKAGIETVAHLMMGSPGETRETIDETINFVKELQPDYASFNLTVPYPGTKMWEMVEKKLPLKKGFSAYDVERTLENADFNEILCGLPKDELNRYYEHAYQHFYFSPRYIFNRLKKQRSLGDLVRLTTAGAYLLGFTLSNKFSHKKKAMPESDIE